MKKIAKTELLAKGVQGRIVFIRQSLDSSLVPDQKLLPTKQPYFVFCLQILPHVIWETVI